MMQINSVQAVPKIRELAKQTQRRPLDLKDRRSVLRSPTRCGARDAGQDGHLAKLPSRRYGRNAKFSTVRRLDEDVHFVIGADVEGIAAPVALADDRLAGFTREKLDIRANLLPLVVPAIYADFQVQFVFVMAVVHAEQVSERWSAFDGTKDFAAALYLSGHRLTYSRRDRHAPDVAFLTTRLFLLFVARAPTL